MKKRFVVLLTVMTMLLAFALQSFALPGLNVSATETEKMFRLYNPNSGEHFYTAKMDERDMLVSVGWQSEGTAWYAPKNSNSPVYRLYNPNSGEHHYTTNADEKNMLTSIGWNDEGIGWYSDDAKGEPLYRLYNPNATGKEEPGAHHYTTNIGEKDSLVSIGWRDEGIGWYGINSSAANPVPSGFTSYSEKLAIKDLGSFVSSNYTYHVVLVHNRSLEAVDVTLRDTSYTSEGTPVDVGTGGIYCLEAGKIMAIWTMHEGTNIVSFDNNLTEESISASKVQQYSDVQMTSSINAKGDKVIVKATNTSASSIQYTEVVVVFFKDGKLVGKDWGYMDLENGKTDSRDFYMYEKDFDNYEVYYTAYSYDFSK